jgi:protocatechuate 3,4-dioxygenase beta subunit
MTTPTVPDPARRSLLRALALAPFSAAAAAAPSWAQQAAGGAGLIAANVCMLSPQATEGPYYLQPGLVRRDITEARPGLPVTLALQVVTADCTPVKGARVDLWHCDADGNYSGFARQGSDTTNDTSGETFLRGTQFTDRGGVALFRTIYPGWYRGRATHFHYKVFLDRRTVLTSQIFLPDAVSQRIYRTVAPYDARSADQRIFNGNDAVAARAGEGACASLRERGAGYDASIVVGIDAGAF